MALQTKSVNKGGVMKKLLGILMLLLGLANGSLAAQQKVIIEASLQVQVDQSGLLSDKLNTELWWNNKKIAWNTPTILSVANIEEFKFAVVSVQSTCWGNCPAHDLKLFIKIEMKDLNDNVLSAKSKSINFHIPIKNVVLLESVEIDFPQLPQDLNIDKKIQEFRDEFGN